MSKGGARPGAGRKRTPIDEKRAISLRNQGMSYQRIANRFGLSQGIIRYFFRRIKSNVSGS